MPVDWQEHLAQNMLRLQKYELWEFGLAETLFFIQGGLTHVKFTTACMFSKDDSVGIFLLYASK